jgi:histidine triad (HIT) family protein
MSGDAETCVFCQILRGEATPGVIAYRDAETAVFPTRGQTARNRGHMLVVPTRHVAQIYDVGADLAGPLMLTVARVAVAVKAAFAADGVTIRQNNEKPGGQDVFHVHFHVIPRYAGDSFDVGDERYPFGAKAVSVAERVQQARRLAQALERS